MLFRSLSLEIKEIMITGNNIPVVKEDSFIKDVIFEISSKRLGTTCVIDKEGKLTGIITDGDLRRLLEKTLDIQNIIASDLMSINPKVMKPNILASFALQQMENFKITSIVITDDNHHPVGIVHLHDLINLGLRQR